MPVSKRRKVKDQNSRKYNKNATPKIQQYDMHGTPIIVRTHTDPIIRTKENAGRG